VPSDRAPGLCVCVGCFFVYTFVLTVSFVTHKAKMHIICGGRGRVYLRPASLHYQASSYHSYYPLSILI